MHAEWRMRESGMIKTTTIKACVNKLKLLHNAQRSIRPNAQIYHMGMNKQWFIEDFLLALDKVVGPLD